MFIVYHSTWERKPCFTNLFCDGIFPTWEDAFHAAFNNIINGDIDTGEIRDGTETPLLLYTGPVPKRADELNSRLKTLEDKDPYTEVREFGFGEFADFSHNSKRFHVKRVI